MIRTLLLSSFIILLSGCPSFLAAQTPVDKKLFECGIACIKYFEGWHTARNYPYIGYGHKRLPGERLTSNLSRTQADSLLRADLRKRYVTFRRFGKDAVLLTVLSYNVGESRLIGSGKIPKSNLIKKLEKGDRNIYKEYISYRKYKGKVVPSIERRRKCEFVLLYIP